MDNKLGNGYYMAYEIETLKFMTGIKLIVQSINFNK